MQAALTAAAKLCLPGVTNSLAHSAEKPEVAATIDANARHWHTCTEPALRELLPCADEFAPVVKELLPCADEFAPVVNDPHVTSTCTSSFGH